MDLSGLMSAEVDMMVRTREDQLNIKINKMEEQVSKATEVVNDISQRVFNMENNKKNNLIFNGIVQEEGETKVIV